MMAHPPEFAEDLLGWCLPPACREEVLGDLWESCTNPLQYAMCALAVIPRVIASQIRRNTDAFIFLLTTCGICYSVAAGGVNLSLDSDPNSLLRLAIPVVPAVLILLIRNGFASLEDRRRRAITLDITIAMGVAALTQLILLASFRYDLMLSRWCPTSGTVLAWLFVILLRAIFPPGTKLPSTYRTLS
jgi:hypothetical protein